MRPALVPAPDTSRAILRRRGSHAPARCYMCGMSTVIECVALGSRRAVPSSRRVCSRCSCRHVLLHASRASRAHGRHLSSPYCEPSILRTRGEAEEAATLSAARGRGSPMPLSVLSPTLHSLVCVLCLALSCGFLLVLGHVVVFVVVLVEQHGASPQRPSHAP